MIQQNVIIFQGEDYKSKLKVVEATTVILFFTGGVNFRLSLMTYFNTPNHTTLRTIPADKRLKLRKNITIRGRYIQQKRL